MLLKNIIHFDFLLLTVMCCWIEFLDEIDNKCEMGTMRHGQWTGPNVSAVVSRFRRNSQRQPAPVNAINIQAWRSEDHGGRSDERRSVRPCRERRMAAKTR